MPSQRRWGTILRVLDTLWVFEIPIQTVVALSIFEDLFCNSKIMVNLLLQPNQIGMTWQYTIEWHSGQVSALSNSNRKSIVIVTSKPRSQTESTLIKVKTWTSQQSNILFAQVLRGDSPVIGAKVMASVMLESSNNDSLVTLSPVRLHDNGYGGKNTALSLLPNF